MYTLIVILGGVALILHGVKTLRKGLDRLLGDRLGPFLERASNRRAGAVLTGVGMSLLAPSSTSVSSLAVQAVRAGHVSPQRMLVILLGADIGLTLTVQLMALKLGQHAALFLVFGVAFYHYSTTVRWRGVGQVAMSFGFLFLGIGLIDGATAAIDPHGDLAQVLRIVGRYPVYLAVLTGVMAVALQSSTAAVGVLLGLSGAADLGLTPDVAVAAVCGANVGVGFTMLMIGWGHADARRLSVANLIAKSAVAVAALVLLPEAAAGLSAVTHSLPRLVADAHTGLNLVKLIVVLPLAGPLCHLASRLVPARAAADAADDPAKPRYLGAGPLDGSSLALSQSMREILRVAEIVRGMRDDVWRALRDGDERLARQVSDRDDHVDRLEADIKRFLSRIDAHSLDPDQASERLRQLQYLSELESIGDLIDKNLCMLVVKKVRRRVALPPDAWAALEALDRQIAENMLLADAAFHTGDLDLAAKLLRHKDYIDREVRRLRDAHLAGLNHAAGGSHDSSAVHLDVLTNLKRINSHVCHIAFTLRPRSDGVGMAAAKS